MLYRASRWASPEPKVGHHEGYRYRPVRLRDYGNRHSVRQRGRHAIFLDDNGLLNDPQRFFLIRGYPDPLAGKGLVMGSDAEGNTQAAKTPLKWLQDNIRFAEVVPGTMTLIPATGPWVAPERS